MSNQSAALTLIRFAAAGNMLIHGIYRISAGGVTPFDEWLSSLGFPPFSAWIITVFEIIAALMIIMNRWVSPLSIVFIVQLGMGIFLIHRHEGWFVVGGGRNGMEYSLLMIICFAATALVNWKRK
jgi:putative oxidoreductase